MRIAVIALLLFVASAGSAQEAEPAAQFLERCVEELAIEPTGMEALEAECPGVEAALEELGLAQLLSDQQRERLDANKLADLLDLEWRYREPPAETQLQTGSLQPILESLQDQQRAERQQSWYERLRDWLRNALDRQQASADPWLIRWLNDHQLPDMVRKVLLGGLVVVVLFLALVVVINELRAAGVLRRRKSQRADGDADIAFSAGAAAIADVDLDSVPPGDRPSLLLRMLVAALIKSGKLHVARSLTHRELGVRASFDDPQQRECFQRVAVLAERSLYGGGTPRPDESDPIVQAGRALHARLSGAAR